MFIPGDWIPYLGALATCRSRPFLDWRAAHWIPGASREAAREMAGSLQNARQYLGKEGAFLHA